MITRAPRTKSVHNYRVSFVSFLTTWADSCLLTQFSWLGQVCLDVNGDRMLSLVSYRRWIQVQVRWWLIFSSILRTPRILDRHNREGKVTYGHEQSLEKTAWSPKILRTCDTSNHHQSKEHSLSQQHVDVHYALHKLKGWETRALYYFSEILSNHYTESIDLLIMSQVSLIPSFTLSPGIIGTEATGVDLACPVAAGWTWPAIRSLKRLSSSKNWSNCWSKRLKSQNQKLNLVILLYRSCSPWGP